MAVTETQWNFDVGGLNKLDCYNFGEAFIRRHSATSTQQDLAMHWFHRMATERDW